MRDIITKLPFKKKVKKKGVKHRRAPQKNCCI